MPTIRSGQTVKRIENMLLHNVNPKVIVTQLNSSIESGFRYTEAYVRGYDMLFKDSITHVGVTKEVETALIEDQKIVIYHINSIGINSYKPNYKRFRSSNRHEWN